MATSKTGSKAKKPAAKKAPSRSSATKVTTKSSAAKTKATVVKTAAVPEKKTNRLKQVVTANFPAIIIAEVIGTFVLVLVALSAVQLVTPLFVGITVAVLVLAIGAVSGAHLNPAVTFGLWSARKLKTVLVPVYWVAQFVGAILAVLVLGWISGAGYALDFGHFNNFDWSVVGVEFFATAIFLFGLVAVVSSDSLSNVGKAFGIGLSLTIAIVASVTLFNSVKSSADTSAANVSDLSTIPRSYLVDGATLNPAVALAVTEKTATDLSGYNSGTTVEPEARYSRLGFETIVGTLLGAAFGANLYLLLAYVNRKQQ